MATPWVLLHRTVRFIDGTTSAASTAAATGGVPSPAEAMAAMKPEAAIAEPPEVSYLSMLRQTPSRNTGGIHSGEISSTDEGLAVLYTGTYRPGNGGFSGAGCYLVYDACTGSVARITRLPDHSPLSSSAINGLGRSAAILRVEELWSSESFRGMALPQITPTCPVLSALEEDVVYAALNDVEDVEDVDEFGDVTGCFPELKASYVVRLDMVRNKVLSFTKSSTDDLDWLRPSLLASELSAYVQGPKDPTGAC
ncbi:unnamed protein product [Urochloa decumbens]|uniref:Uncharacterized protein n=1 Tax=Urochloa decumbens TaxID=240449 RepID=A0ABC9CVI7_9POAL